MKQLFLALLMFAGVAHANDIAYTTNRAGGKIIIQSYQCPWPGSEHLRQAYNTVPGGGTQFGCWYYEEGSNTIHAVWVDGSRYAYTWQNFYVFKSEN